MCKAVVKHYRGTRWATLVAVWIAAALGNPYRADRAPVLPVPASARDSADLSREEIALILHNLSNKEGRWAHENAEVLRYGARAFPVYRAVLGDDEYRNVWRRTHYLINRSPGDKRAFREAVLEHLNDESGHLRSCALQNVPEVCPELLGPLCLALLTDRDSVVAEEAADLLAKYGTDAELIAFDTWIRTHNEYMFRRGEWYDKTIRSYRDKLYIKPKRR